MKPSNPCCRGGTWTHTCFWSETLLSAIVHPYCWTTTTQEEFYSLLTMLPIYITQQSVHLLRGGSHPCLSASFAFITDAFRKLSRTLTCFHLLDIAGFHGCILYAWGGGRMISPPCYCQGQAMRETSIIFFSLSIAVWYSLSISIPSS